METGTKISPSSSASFLHLLVKIIVQGATPQALAISNNLPFTYLILTNIIMLMQAFAKSVFTITIFAVCTRAIGFIFRIFLSRILGAEMLGVYQMSMSIFMVLLTVISSGLPLVMSREVAKADKDKNKIFNITIAGVIIGVVASVLLCLFVLIFQSLLGFVFTDKRSIAILIAMLPAVIASSVYCVLRAIWWGEKKFFLLGLTELIEQVARVLLFVLFLGFTFFFADLAHLSAWSFTGACIVSAVVVIIIFLKTNKLAKTKIEKKDNYIKPLLKSSLPITGVRLLSSIAFPIVSVLLPIRLIAAGWTSINAISHFGIIVGMTFPLLTIPSTIISSLATALVPELSRLAITKEWDKARHQIKTAMNFSIFVNFIFIPIYIALGVGIGKFLFNDTNSGIYLARSAWAMVPISLSQITSASLNSLNKESIAMRNYFIGSVVLFLVIWFLPKYIGADSVVVGLGLSMAVSSLLNILAIRKCTEWKKPDKTLVMIFSYVCISIPTFCIGYFTYNLFQFLPLIIKLLMSAVLAFGAFFSLAWSTDLIILPKKRK